MSNLETEIPRVLIIGYGNPLRGDDAVGWVAAQKLGDRFDSDDRVTALAVHQLTPELAHPISKVELAIFIDAAEGEPPGLLSCRFIKPAAHQPTSMTHGFEPQRLLAMARTIYGHCPQAMLFTVGAEDFGHREYLTRTVDRACERLVEHICRIIIDELEHAPCMSYQ